MPANLGPVGGSNISGIIKRNKYAPITEESSNLGAVGGGISG
jgi:hypothetical protein